MSLFCSSSPESRLELPAGASALRLNRGCRVTAQGWSISSIARFSSTVMVDFAVINIPPMKLLNLIPHETLLTQLASPVWDSLGEINDVQLDALPLNDNDVLTWGSYSGHVSWTVALLVIVLSAGLIYILFVLYRHHLIKPITVRQPPPTKTDDHTPGPSNSEPSSPARKSVIYHAPTKTVSLPSPWSIPSDSAQTSGKYLELQRTQ